MIVRTCRLRSGPRSSSAGTARHRVCDCRRALSDRCACAQSSHKSRPIRRGPIRIVVGQQPGVPSDILARLVAEKLADLWKEPVVVENQPGASGTIGAELVAKAPADGYTLLMASHSNLVLAKATGANLRYDPLSDFAPIGRIAYVPFVLAVHQKVPARTIPELVAFARRHPGQLTYATAGSGTMSQLGIELLKAATGIDLLAVHYKGAGSALHDVIAGRVDMILADYAVVAPHVSSGALRVLGLERRAPGRRSARRSDLRRAGDRRLRGQHVVRDRRAGENAGRHSRQAGECAERDPEFARGARTPPTSSATIRSTIPRRSFASSSAPRSRSTRRSSGAPASKPTEAVRPLRFARGSVRRSGMGSDPPAAERTATPASAASSAIVGASKIRRSGSLTFALPRRSTTCAASSECPPSSKKLSSTPTRSILRTSRQTSAISCSSGLRGATYALPSSSGRCCGAGNALQVDLAVRHQRQLLQDNELRRHHVLGKTRSQSRAQSLDEIGRSAVRHDVGDELRTARQIRAQQDRRAAHVGLLRRAAPRSRRARSESRGASPGGRCGR